MGCACFCVCVELEIKRTSITRSIPSPKIVGARSPRPANNTLADASALTSLQSGKSLNIGQGNPEETPKQKPPTHPHQDAYLKILPKNREHIFIDQTPQHHGETLRRIHDTSIQFKRR